MRKLKIPLICALALILCASALLLTAPGAHAADSSESFFAYDDVFRFSEAPELLTSELFVSFRFNSRLGTFSGFHVDDSFIKLHKADGCASDVIAYDYRSGWKTVGEMPLEITVWDEAPDLSAEIVNWLSNNGSFIFDLRFFNGGSLIRSSSDSSFFTLTVTESGCTYTSAEGVAESYSPTVEGLFLGFATSSGGDVVYTPGNTYTFDSAAELHVVNYSGPIYEATFYSPSGTQVSSTSVCFSPLTLTVTPYGATISDEDGKTFTYTYDGSDIFTGFAVSADGTPIYSPGNTYVLSYSTSLYAVVSTAPTPTGELTDVFSNVAAWFAGVATVIVGIFWSAEGGLTFLGWLAIAGLAFSVILLLFFFIRRWLF